MPSCFICKRSRSSTSKLQNITFHKFLTNQTIRDKWYDFVIENGLKIDNINNNSILCSSHFDESLFLVHKNTRHLCKNAVPNIIISRAKNVYPEVRKSGQSSSFFLEALSDLPTNDIGYEQLSIPAEQPLQLDSNTNSEDYTIQVSLSYVLNNLFIVEKSEVFLAASNIVDQDTPKRKFLKFGVCKLLDQVDVKNKKKYNLRRANKKIASLKTIISQLRKENLINDDASNILLESFGKQKI
ncbi:hypothetical protein AGLY_007391 [Aphis glycines]|uniref:THAP-type domain-containing protein n=1 Tax=Aphis glycines TaxID=307491 RepID=A0A6G0TQS8_APHGL|nr:hypothetical protein AGLY_007391 [Aphis glycines]